MSLEKNRHIQIVLYFLHNEKMITSDELADITKASTRTIKNDIHVINDDIKEHGFEILSKKSEGYYLNVFDEAACKKYEKNLKIVAHYTDTDQELSYQLRIRSIIEILLMAKDYVSLDELAEAVFVSKSVIKLDLQKVRGYLESYWLKLESKSNYGIKVVGKELRIRHAIINFYGINVPTYDDELRAELFHSQLQSDDYDDVRHIELDVLRENHYSIKDNASQGLARYLIVSRNRLKSGYPTVTLSDKTKKELDQFEVQKAITTILFERLKDFDGFDFSEDEKYAVQMYLVAYHDYEGAEITPNTMKFLFGSIQQMYYEVNEYIKNTMGLQDEFNHTKEQLFYNVARIVTRNHFKMQPYNRISYGQAYEGVKSNPTAITLASYLASYFEERLFCRLNTKDVLYLAHYFDELLDQIQFEYHPLKLVTTSGVGKNYAELIVNNLNEKFGQYIAENQALELYEIRPYSKEEIDLVVMDNLFNAYRYDIPYALVGRKNYAMLIEALKDGYDIEDEVNELTAMLKIYPNYEFLNYQDCFRILSYKYGADDLSITEMIQTFKRHEERISYARYGFVLLMADYRFIQKNCLEVYKLKQEMIWSENFTVRYVIFFSIDFQKNLKLMKALAALMSSLYEDEKLFDALYQTEDKHDLIKKAVLKQISLL